MKRIVFLSTVAAFLPQVSHACIKLDGVAVQTKGQEGDSQFSAVGLRHGGDIWAPAQSGCNLIPCGTFGNHEGEGKRLRFSAKDDASIKIQSELTKLWEGGHVEFEFKYGANPDFSKTPGWSQGNIVVAPDSDISQILKTFTVDPAFSYNATIQVAYHTNGLERQQIPGHNHRESEDMSAKFYQCIDIEVVDGQPYPVDAPAGGLGPYEVDGFPDINVGGLSQVEPPGLKPFWIAFIVLALLIGLGLCLMIYLWQTKKADEDDGEFEPVVAKTEPVPEPPAKPATPPPEPEEEEEEAVARIHYKDEDPVEVEEPEVSEAKPSDGTGSQGRHFHFRYVEEDSQV